MKKWGFKPQKPRRELYEENSDYIVCRINDFKATPHNCEVIENMI